MKSIHHVVAMGALLASLGACEPQSVEEPNFLGSGTIAEVNGVPIYESVFRVYALNRAQKAVDELTPEERAGIIEEVLQLYLLAGAAETQAIHEERAIAAQIELQRVNALARTAIARYQEGNEATELELREAYDASLQELGATQFKARHILVKTEAEATAVIAQLKSGADFGELAKEHSTGPTGPNGGDLGWFDANTMVPPFAGAVQALAPGSFSERPVETRFGWHVILLEDSRDNEPPGLDAVRDQIKNAVEQSKIEGYVTSLKDEAVIDLMERSEELDVDGT